MAIKSSGSLSMTEIVDEFGGSVPHSLSEYYRNGGAVPGNNTNVPTSGTISMSNFYNAVNEIQITVSSSSTNYQTSNAFGSNWTTAVPKRLTINNGVTLGSSNGNPAMVIEGSMGGTLIVHNSGNIHGTGGSGSNSGSGGNAGPAVRSDQNGNITFYNNAGGQVYAGGGGGGKGGTGGAAGAGGTGGTGGAGQYTQSQGKTGYWTYGSGCHYYSGYARIGASYGDKNGCLCGSSQPSGSTGYSVSNSQSQSLYIRGRFRHGQTQATCHYNFSSTGGSGGSGGSGGGGGAGGAGGNGIGYNQSRQNGSGGASGSGGSGGASGAGGGTNAGSGGQGGTGGTGGTGGSGGNGGDWGQAGGGGAGAELFPSSIEVGPGGNSRGRAVCSGGGAGGAGPGVPLDAGRPRRRQPTAI